MKLFSFLRRFVCGESVIGPAHIAKSLPNQDAFLCVKKRKYLLLVVSDGMGSKPFADIGSRAACSAVRNQIEWFIQQKGQIVPPEVLFKSIVYEWKKLILPHEAKECSATCLFLFATKHKILASRLGDGMISLIAKDSAKSVLLSEKKDGDFSNVTCSLSDSTVAQEVSYSLFERGDFAGAVLATDGISADLQDGKELDFSQGLFSELEKTHFWKRRKFLRNMLENWSVPHHTDDKTIVALGF